MGVLVNGANPSQETNLQFDEKKYPYLAQYADFMQAPNRPVVGREREIRRLLASLNRAELSNAFLLGDAGSGKTMLVQGTSVQDTGRIYVQVDLAKMAASENGEDGAVQMASRIKGLFEDAMKYKADVEQLLEENAKNQDDKRNKKDKPSAELVLFIDEFHLLVQLSTAAAQSIKPILAESGHLGVKIIAATTFAEFHEFVEKDQALMQRLQRINIREPEKKTVVSILKSIAKSHGVLDEIYDPQLLELIYDYSNRYVPADSQPRKSILMLDSMIGWYRTYPGEFKMDRHLLAAVISDNTGVQVTFEIDGRSIEKELNNRVYSQAYATKALEQRLQIAVADLHDKSRPISSFLFSGPTGSGKATSDDTMIPVFNEDGGKMLYKRNGNLVVGDYVFNRIGKPVKITGVYPQGKQQAYKVVLTDGRSIICNDEHLWTWSHRHGNGKHTWKTNTLRELMDKGISYVRPDGRVEIKFVIPMNEPVQRMPYEVKNNLDPYVLGALIGNGCFTQQCLTFSSDDEETVAEISHLLGAFDYKKQSVSDNYNWSFVLDGSKYGRGLALYQTLQTLASVPELIGLKSGEKFIPEEYKGGSIGQRWSLVQGLFDTDGTIGKSDRHKVSYSSSSKQLVEDIQEVLYSLGVPSSITCGNREGKSDEYLLFVKTMNKDKYKFFRLTRKKEIAEKAVLAQKTREKSFDRVGIREVIELDEQVDMTCIMVDDEEHLYQAGKGHIVTHNTEMVKGLSELLFGEERAMIRFDMSEYALENSLDRFREELTDRVWNKSHAVLLFDEVEKANPVITRLMLQVLDDGRLSNAQGREVSFLNTYIILTTNAGSEIYESIAHYSQDDEGAGGMAEYQKVIRRSLISNESFAPEIINRMNAIIPFQPLSHKTYEKIILNKLRGLQEDVYRVHGIQVMIHPDVVGYLVYESFDIDTNSGGARGLVARMDTEVVSPLSRYINKHADAKHIGVHVKGKMAYRHKDMRESAAHIEVGTVDQKRARRG